MQAKSLQTFDRQIQRIQAQLATLGPMRPGTLTRQYRQPQLQQGAYYQLSYTYRMKSHTEYVPKREVGTVRKEIAIYQRYKKLAAQWVDLALQRSWLRMKLARSAASPSGSTKEDSRSNLGRPKPKNPQKNSLPTGICKQHSNGFLREKARPSEPKPFPARH